jgi:hypothetical protein
MAQLAVPAGDAEFDNLVEEITRIVMDALPGTENARESADEDMVREAVEERLAELDPGRGGFHAGRRIGEEAAAAGDRDELARQLAGEVLAGIADALRGKIVPDPVAWRVQSALRRSLPEEPGWMAGPPDADG